MKPPNHAKPFEHPYTPTDSSAPNVGCNLCDSNIKPATPRGSVVILDDGGCNWPGAEARVGVSLTEARSEQEAAHVA